MSRCVQRITVAVVRGVLQRFLLRAWGLDSQGRVLASMPILHRARVIDAGRPAHRRGFRRGSRAYRDVPITRAC